MGHPRQGYRRHTGQCRQRFAIDMDGGRDIFACRSVSERIRPYLFPFGFLPPKLLDIKPRGNGKPWGDGACRRGYGRPERERLHMTSLFLLWLLLRPIPFRVPDSGNIIWHCYYKPAVSCLTALHLGSKNIN